MEMNAQRGGNHLQFLPVKSSFGNKPRKFSPASIAHKSVKLEEEVETSMKVLQLVDESKFVITQINGQRRLGPPLNWNGTVPGHGCEVFVGKIPKSLYEYDIYPVFRRMGEIFEIRLMMDFSGTNRGYCFVMYTRAEYATRAVIELDQYEIRPGQKIGVVASVNNCRLFIGQFPTHISTEIIVRKVYKSTDEVDKVVVYRHPKNTVSYALVTYKTHRGAAIARRSLLPTASTIIPGLKLYIEWAHPNMSPTNVFEESGTCDKDGKVKMKRRFIRPLEGKKHSVVRDSKKYISNHLNGQLHNGAVKDTHESKVAVGKIELPVTPFSAEYEGSLLSMDHEQLNKETILSPSNTAVLPTDYNLSTTHQVDHNQPPHQIAGQFIPCENSQSLMYAMSNGSMYKYGPILSRSTTVGNGHFTDYGVQLQEIPQNANFNGQPITQATNSRFTGMNNFNGLTYFNGTVNGDDHCMINNFSIFTEQKENEDPRNYENTAERQYSLFSAEPKELMRNSDLTIPRTVKKQEIFCPLSYRPNLPVTSKPKASTLCHVSTNQSWSIIDDKIILLDKNSNEKMKQRGRPILCRFRDN